MLKREVEVGKTYIAKVSGKLVTIKLISVSQYGGWNAINESSKREIRIKSAARLRKEVISGT